VRRRPIWLAGVISALGALSAAALYLAANAWFGAGDLFAMFLWSIPLGLIVAVTTGFVSPRLSGVSAFTRYALLLPLGGLLGFLWTALAALLLGGWIGAFSFPVFFCWVAGGLLGGIAAAWLPRPQTWPVALALSVAVGGGLLPLNAYARAPEPRVRVVVKPGATPSEVDRVWTEVLERPGARPSEHTMLPGISSIAASGHDGASAVLTVSFWKSLSRSERDSLIAQIGRSPLVARVDIVPANDTTGVRISTSY
jgi:hypothetical protein